MESAYHAKLRRVIDEYPGEYRMNNSWRYHYVKIPYCIFIKCAIILSLFTAFNWAPAQVIHSSQQLSTEQLLQYFRSLKNPSQQRVLSNEFTNGKCGFGINAALHSQWSNFTGLQKMEIKKLIIIPQYQKDRFIGKFHIYYDTTGANEPALLDASNHRISNTAEEYVDSVGRIFNDVYKVEIGLLGYAAPPFESGETYYRIFISNMSNYSSGTYGSTNWDESLSPLNTDGSAPRYPCFIELHNDFIEFYTKGMNAVKVTAAHEFHHMIQIGSYGFRSDDLFFYEITSTWMEDVVYTYVNDYYNYLYNYFNYFSRGISFNAPDHGGYERCIWAHYLAKRFGPSIMLNVWDGMKTLPFLESTNTALVNRGSNLQTAFSEFTYWNYFTADRADTVRYYPEGNHYPRFQPLQQKSYQNMPDSIGGYIYPLSSSMYEFDLLSDTITAMISNVEVDAAEQKDDLTRRIDIVFSLSVPSVPYQEFSSGLMAKVIVTDTSLWRSSFSQGIRRDTVITPLRFAVSSNASPNPFRLMDSQKLLLPIQDTIAKTADVYFYSSSLNLAYSKLLPVSIAGSNHVIAVLSSELKSNLSSGIYFVIAKTKNNEYRWKVAVIR
jgi:uncharacterized protein YegP (UPF0339 family)